MLARVGLAWRLPKRNALPRACQRTKRFFAWLPAAFLSKRSSSSDTSHHSVITMASTTATRVKPPPRAVTATMPATIQSAASIQTPAETAWRVPWCPLIVVCISASLGLGSPCAAQDSSWNTWAVGMLPVWGNGDQSHSADRSAGGGTRTLFGYLARWPKRALAAETHYGSSRQLSVTTDKYGQNAATARPRCTHRAGQLAQQSTSRLPAKRRT